MEFEDGLNESPRLCRCCLSEGCYKDMGTEYAWMNETEVYADMLLECFDISISQVKDGPNGPNRLICEVCITRLRDACYFKKQVLDTEKKFIDMVGRGDLKPKELMLYHPTVKLDDDEMKVSLELEDNMLPRQVEYLEDNMDYVDDTPLMEGLLETEPTSSEVTADPLPIRSKRGRPKKATAKTEKNVKLETTAAKSSKALVKETATTGMTRNEANKHMRQGMAQLVKVVTENSTIFPFRWSTKHYFTCFFCGKSFDNIRALKQHSTVTHDIDKLASQKFYYLSRIKLDVSEIICKRCSTEFGDFNGLLDHLLLVHDKYFDKDLMSKFACFKLNDDNLMCLHCGERFSFFGSLLIHDNKYHNNSDSFTCNVCGDSFISKYILASHIHYKHGEKRCKVCNEVFKTAFALLSHKQKVHDVNQLKCNICKEIFRSKYLQKQHMNLVHGVGGKQLFCETCSKTFVTKKTLRDHIGRVHKKEKSVACEICGFTVYSKGVLTLHMVKHKDARPFTCAICSKTFRRKKTLEMHLKLVHTKCKHGNLQKHIRVSHAGAKGDILQRQPATIEN